MANGTEYSYRSAPYRRRYAALKRKAAPLLRLWQDLNEYVLPWSGRFLFSDKDQPGVRRGDHVYNSTTYNAVQTAASGLHGGLTSPSRPWFELTHPDKDMMENAEVKAWIFNLQENERRALSGSNFYDAIQALYYEALTYGQGVMFIERDDKRTLRCRTLTCGEYVLANGADLSVDTVYRRFTMTAGQMREQFGEENLSQTIREALREKALDREFFIIQCVQPWGTFDSRNHNKNWQYESVYFEESCDDENTLLARKGYRTQPFVAVRWGVAGDDVYGYSPGEMSLADIRQLQTQERSYVNAVNWISNPAWLVSDSIKGALANGDIRPGAIIAASPQDGQYLMRPLFQPNFDFNNIRIKIQDVIERIRANFYNPLFLMIQNRERQMTAAEVMQLVEEKATLLGPVLERFQSEIFDPLLDRVYDILDGEFHLVPPPPQELRGQDLEIEYVSLLAQAQKQAGLSNLTHFLSLATQLQPVFPSAMDKIDADEVIDTMAAISPVNPSIIRSDEDVAAMRKQAAEQARQQQLAESIPNLAGAARDLSQSEPAAGNLMGEMMGMRPEEGAV